MEMWRQNKREARSCRGLSLLQGGGMSERSDYLEAAGEASNFYEPPGV